MKKVLICLIAALVLTPPIYIGLALFGPIDRWFKSGAGWIAFDPLFRLGVMVGISDQASIVINTMLIVSFAIACMAVWFTSTLVRKFAANDAST